MTNQLKLPDSMIRQFFMTSNEAFISFFMQNAVPVHKTYNTYKTLFMAYAINFSKTNAAVLEYASLVSTFITDKSITKYDDLMTSFLLSLRLWLPLFYEEKQRERSTTNSPFNLDSIF